VTGSQPWFRWEGADLELRVKARTQCRDEGLVAGEDALHVRVNAPPVEGRANKRVLVVVAEAFGVPKSRVKLTHGARSRLKRVRIERPRRVPQSLEPVLGAPRRVEKSPKPV